MSNHMSTERNSRKANKQVNKSLDNRPPSLVVVLISFLTFWSLAISSFDNSTKPQHQIRAAITLLMDINNN